MNLPAIVSREQWLEARRSLLEKEKKLTRIRDALSAERRRMPMVRMEKPYQFDGPEGAASLGDLFEGHRQLIVFHFGFDPVHEEGCPKCAAAADEIADGLIDHLNARDTTLVFVSRAPLEAIERYKEKRGWSVPWYSSYDSDFNFDFQATVDPSRGADSYNYRGVAEHDGMAEGGRGSVEMPGYSCFLRDGEEVFHTYSTYARGTEETGGAHYWLDLTALGRQDEWAEHGGSSPSIRPGIAGHA